MTSNVPAAINPSLIGMVYYGMESLSTEGYSDLSHHKKVLKHKILNIELTQQ